MGAAMEQNAETEKKLLNSGKYTYLVVKMASLMPVFLFLLIPAATFLVAPSIGVKETVGFVVGFLLSLVCLLVHFSLKYVEFDSDNLRYGKKSVPLKDVQCKLIPPGEPSNAVFLLVQTGKNKFLSNILITLPMNFSLRKDIIAKFTDK